MTTASAQKLFKQFEDLDPKSRQDFRDLVDEANSWRPSEEEVALILKRSAEIDDGKVKMLTGEELRGHMATKRAELRSSSE